MESNIGTNTSTEGPLHPRSLRHPDKLAGVLREAGYTEGRLAATIGLSHPGDTLDLAMAVRRAASSEAYDVFIRLFLLGRVVGETEARHALAAPRWEELIECGLLVPVSEGVRSNVKILPHADLMCVSDFGRAEAEREIPRNHVLGIGPASITVAKLTVPRPGGEVFDLGCGAGIQSLLAAQTAQRVVGSDTNPRALNFARFNAHLNGITQVDWRMGSFFEPVVGELFDGIIANPPFVISPRGKFLFCDSKLSGDGVSEHVVRHAATHLKEGGFATILFNWHYDGGDDWERRPFEWCEANGCDCWLVRSGDAEPLTYAANWLCQGEKREGERYGRLLDEWLDYYARLGIERLCSGAMILRKRTSSSNWRRADSMEVGNAVGSAGEHIERLFNLETLLHEEGDMGLLNREWRVHRDTHLRQELGWDGDGWTLRAIAVNLEKGLPFAGHGDAALVRLLTGCRGERSLRALIEELARDMETAFETVAPSALGVARKMVRSGILIPS